MRFLASLPERIVRALAALLGGAVHETAELVLPRVVRRSRFYEATAKNALRICVELVGEVETTKPAEPAPAAKELAVRKGAGNVVELGSIAAFGFSPLWLLAAASDVIQGSRVYLQTLAGELKRAGVLGEDADVASFDELLGVLERGSGGAARLIDVPPVELEELRASVAELAAERDALPRADELAAAFDGLRRTAAAEQKSLLEVSAGVGLAFLLCSREVSRRHLAVPYREDWQPVGREGFAGYVARVAAPYRRAVEAHFDPARPTWTEKALGRISHDA